MTSAVPSTLVSNTPHDIEPINIRRQELYRSTPPSNPLGRNHHTTSNQSTSGDRNFYESTPSNPLGRNHTTRCRQPARQNITCHHDNSYQPCLAILSRSILLCGIADGYTAGTFIKSVSYTAVFGIARIVPCNVTCRRGRLVVRCTARRLRPWSTS